MEEMGKGGKDKKEGRREGRKEGRKDGGKKGRKEEGKEGRREGGKEERRKGGRTEGRSERRKEEGMNLKHSPETYKNAKTLFGRYHRVTFFL